MAMEIAATAAKLNTLLVKPQTQVCIATCAPTVMERKEDMYYFAVLKY